MATIKEKLKILKEKISIAATNAHRDPNFVKYIAVSKTQPIDKIQLAFEAGLTNFGENYVQEFLKKYADLKDLDISWHFIGHLQSNKVKDIVGKCEAIHSVDSFKLAKQINQQASLLKIVQKVLLQINLAGENQKSGFNKENYLSLQAELALFNNIEILGFMLVPPLEIDPEINRPYFKELKNLLDQANRSGHYRKPLRELSMGMTHDFEIAIEEGATMIRIGTYLFGERTP